MMTGDPRSPIARAPALPHMSIIVPGRRALTMTEGDRTAARRRASYARADRLKKEAAQAAGEKEQERKAGLQQSAEAKKAAERQDKQRQAFEQRKDEARKQQQWKAFEQRKADAAKREFNRKAEDAKALEQQKADRRQEANRKAEQRMAEAKQEAQRRAEQRKADAYVQAQFRQQLADQIAEHRRQTDRLRAQHREQSSSLKDRGDEAITRHWHGVKGIDEREARALKEFDAKRASLTGRAAELVRGKAHFERRREEMQKGFESDRLHKHRDLEALKERQSAARQEQHLRHVQERKAILDTHRAAREETLQRQERDRPRLIEERLQAVARNAEIARSHQQEQTRERGLSLRSEFGR